MLAAEVAKSAQAQRSELKPASARAAMARQRRSAGVPRWLARRSLLKADVGTG
jgi:hypothetical protein